MVASRSVRDIAGLKERMLLNSPLCIVRTGSSASLNLRALVPDKWEELERMPPNALAFDLTEYCNASCTFCCYKGSNPQHQMSYEVFVKALQQYHDAGGKQIRLNAMTGEPLLDPGFKEKMNFLRSMAPGAFDRVGLTTNGILLDRDELVESVVTSGINMVTVSTAGFHRETYERIMGVKKYDEFLSGLIKLLERNREAGYPMFIDLSIRGLLEAVDHDDFWNKVYPYIESSGGKVSVSFLRLYSDWIGRVKREDLPYRCGLRPKSHVRIKPCQATFLLCIRANGDLRICSGNWGTNGRSDELTIGNLNTGNLMDIWYSENTKKIRRTTFGKDLCEPCSRCYWNMPIYRKNGEWVFH